MKMILFLALQADRDDHSQVSYRTDDLGLGELDPRWPQVHALVRALPKFGAGALHRHKQLRHAVPRMVCQWKLNSRAARIGGCLNTNVLGRPATAADAACIRDTLEQLDAWIALRTRGQNELLGDARFPTHVTAPAGWRKLADFVLALASRQLAVPGVVDRAPDYQPPGVAAGSAAEMFYNLDAAAERGDVTAGFDLDAAGFAVKDSAALTQLVHAAGAPEWLRRVWHGSVFVRLSGTPCPSHLLPTAARTVAAGLGDGGVHHLGEFVQPARPDGAGGGFGAQPGTFFSAQPGTGFGAQPKKPRPGTSFS